MSFYKGVAPGIVASSALAGQRVIPAATSGGSYKSDLKVLKKIRELIGKIGKSGGGSEIPAGARCGYPSLGTAKSAGEAECPGDELSIFFDLESNKWCYKCLGLFTTESPYPQG